jgi:hypothetical protein
MVAIRVLLGELRRRRWKKISIESPAIRYDLGSVEALETGNPEMTLQAEK